MSRVTERAAREIGKSRSGKNGADRGICAVCENDPTCIYPRAPERPVLQCEELAVDGVLALRKSWNNHSASSDPIFRFSPDRFRKMQRVV
ncbi:MAG: hypothetical protein ACREOI_35700 [bacterium]